MKTLQTKEKINKVGEFYYDVSKANEDYLKYWLDNTLFHWDFWLSLIVFTIIPIVFWIKIEKKKAQIVFYLQECLFLLLLRGLIF